MKDPEESKPVVKPKAPTDFSEFHQQEQLRRKLEEEQKENGVWKKPEEKQENKPRIISEEEWKLWMELEELEKREEEMDVDVEEDVKPPGAEAEESRRLCKEHLEKRLKILREGRENTLTDEEYDNMPIFDRVRVDYLSQYDWEAEDIDPIVLQFIQFRIDFCPNENIVEGYRLLLENYDTIFGPDFFFLSLYKGTSQLQEFEKWSLFGY